MLITSVNGIIKGYWYKEGYLRTSSANFNLSNLSNKIIHLTNDAIQKRFDGYGKFENGNKVYFFIYYINIIKLSYSDFNKYLSLNHPEWDFYRDIIP